MRKLITGGLIALSLIGGATAASAQYYDRGYDRYDRYDRHDRYDRYDRHHRYDRRDRYDGRYDGRYRRHYYDGPRHTYRGSWERHVRRCLAAYRTYNPRTDMYYVRPGVRAYCRL